MNLAKIGKKALYLLLASFFLVVIAFFYFRYQVFYSRAEFPGTKKITISKGEKSTDIAGKMEKEGIVSGRYYFLYYLKSRGLINKIMPGDYEFVSGLTIPEVAGLVTMVRENSLKITFPEGWTSQQMADRLAANGFSKEEFLEAVANPSRFKENYSFLSDSGIKNLEGYLFPETYFFHPSAKAENIIQKMLDVFEERVNLKMREDALKQGHTLREVIIMASLIEGEVRTDEDRRLVSGIFWKRIKEGQPLQSCATLAFITGEKKKQYSKSDTEINSPFNTYLHKGLPPQPISNPGLKSIEAAIYPKESQFHYFLNDPETGQTIFSRTYEEHLSNKAKYGL